MELSERYQAGLKEFRKAIGGFEQGLQINPENYNRIEADLIRNGWLQKFEYCTELCWKLGKALLEWKDGLLISSPKNVYREMLGINYIDNVLCDRLFQTINDRNSMSHIYKEEMFDLILRDIHQHKDTFLKILSVYEDNGKENNPFPRDK